MHHLKDFGPRKWLFAVSFFLLSWPLLAQESMWVETANASRTVIVPVIRVTGTFVPVWKAELAGTYGGKIKNIFAEVGEELASGAVAFAFEEEDVQLALQVAEAAFSTAQKQYDELKSGLRKEEVERLEALKKQAQTFLSQVRNDKDRAERLFNQQAIPASEWEDIGFKEQMAQEQLFAAVATLRAAKAGPTSEQLAVSAALVHQGRVALRQAQKRLEDCLVRVPRKCRVVARFKDIGEIAMGQPRESVLKVVSLDPIKIRFHVGETQVSRVSQGLPVEVKLPDVEGTLAATITTVVPQCDEVTRKIPCEAILDNSQEKAFPGQSAEVIIQLHPESGIAVPATAIIDTDRGKALFIVENNVARLRPVKVLASEEGKVLVEGIKETDLIVARGAMGLKDGASVQVKP